MNAAQFSVSLATSLLLAAAVSAQTITVDITEDIVDIDPETSTVADLPGPDGHISFSEAMIASNNTTGRQTIGFAIPTSQWNYLAWFYTGRAVIHGMMIDAIAWDEVTIDGTTQTAFTGDTNPDGWEVVILRGGGLYLPADNCRVTGLDGTTVFLEGSGGVIENNSTVGIDLYGGSGALVRGNTGGGYVQIDRSNNNVVVGNTLDSVRILGWVGGGRPATSNRIGGPTPAERNHITGLGTLNSQGIPGGFAVQLFDSIGTVIENNWIGTSPDGMQRGDPYTTMGIFFEGENHATIVRNNRVAGILAHAVPPHGPGYDIGTAIAIYGSGSGVLIVGNKIGLNANDEPVLGSVTGISTTNYYLGPVQDVAIGGPAPGEANEIAGHLATGISVANTFAGVRISGNSIHDNGGLGIDLITMGFATGVTANDPLDLDAGGNGLQNFPVIADAVISGGGVSITGSLSSTPGTTFRVEFFASPACDPSGFGEGRLFLGATQVSTDPDGIAVIDSTLSTGVTPGEFVTATARSLATGDTSEFSACVASREGSGCRPDLTFGSVASQPGYGVPNGVLNNDDFFYYLAQFAAGNVAVCDLTSGAVPGSPGYGEPNGVLSNDDFFYYLLLFAGGC